MDSKEDVKKAHSKDEHKAKKAKHDKSKESKTHHEKKESTKPHRKSKHDKDKPQEKPEDKGHIIHHVKKSSESSSTKEKPSSDKKSKNGILTKVLIGISALLVIIVLVNTIMTMTMTDHLVTSVEDVEEQSKPPQLEIAIIEDTNCEDCFDVSVLLEIMQQIGAEVASENRIDRTDPQALDLIKKHDIKKLPTIVVTGDIDRDEIVVLKTQQNPEQPPLLDENNDALVYREVFAPYYDVDQDMIQGLVTATIISDSTCEECYNAALFADNIKESGVKFVEEAHIEATSPQAQEILSKYNLDAVPTIILSKEAELYESIQLAWSQFGTQEEDGFFVMRTPPPLFKRLSTNEVVGIVDVVYLNDTTCTDCYNLEFHRGAVRSIGVQFGEEKVVDIASSEGKALIEKYSITKVPTVILNDDFGAYSLPDNIGEFFKVDPTDGSYIFENIDLIVQSVGGSYIDLTTGNKVPEQDVQ